MKHTGGNSTAELTNVSLQEWPDVRSEQTSAEHKYNSDGNTRDDH